MVSGVYKNLPGILISAVYNLGNLQALPSLGRDLSACRGVTGAACTARVPVDLLPAVSPGTNSGATAARLYDERINQLDLRLSRIFRFGQLRLQGLAELYNVLNIRPAQGITTTYGPAWLLPSAILGGRVFKFGVQIDY